MSLPVSNQLRICTSCDAAIDPGNKFGHDPDGQIICEDCIPADFDFEQYDDPNPIDWSWRFFENAWDEPWE